MFLEKKILVYHVGARDHYAIAKFCASKGFLLAFITDYWINTIPFFLPAKIKKLISRRFDVKLKDNNVISYSFISILKTHNKKRKILNSFNGWIFNDQYFTNFVIKKIKNMRLKPEVIWGYTNANLEILQFYKNENVLKIHNQIDPGLEYYELQQSIWENNRDFEDQPQPITNAFKQRILEEWNLADVIVVNSNYSKKSLVKNGVSEKKIELLPLIIEQNISKTDKKFNQKLKVAFVGNISLIKGFHLFMEVAEKLETQFDFIAIGNFKLKEEIKKSSSHYILYTGQISKLEMKEWYKKIDILVFPSQCDGFGMVQLEAMKFGIPVLATEKCGEVVVDGYNGNIINSSQDIIRYLSIFNEDRFILNKYSENAILTIAKFSAEEFASKLENFLQKRL